MTIQEALARYARVAGPRTVQQTQAIISRYLAAGGDGTDARLTRYLRDLEAGGYARGTVDRHRRVIRAFYRALGARPPVALGWRYDNAVEGHRVALATATVAQLIAAARAGQLTHRQAGCLALSTVYGLRVEEIAAVRPEDIDAAGSRIFIRTAKGGLQRWQWLPPAIAPWLAVSWPRTSARALAGVWHDLISRAGLTVPTGVGWHAVRRALARDLERAGVGDADRARFFRWASGAAPGQRLAHLYATPTAEVQPDGTVHAVAPAPADLRDVDGAVWDRHPYLAWWTADTPGPTD